LVHFPVLVCCAKKNLATLGLDGPIFAGKIWASDWQETNKLGRRKFWMPAGLKSTSL
jgi:hypothetical protein